MLQVLTFLTKQRNFATLASESLEIKGKTRLSCCVRLTFCCWIQVTV